MKSPRVLRLAQATAWLQLAGVGLAWWPLAYPGPWHWWLLLDVGFLVLLGRQIRTLAEAVNRLRDDRVAIDLPFGIGVCPPMIKAEVKLAAEPEPFRFLVPEWQARAILGDGENWHRVEEGE